MIGRTTLGAALIALSTLTAAPANAGVTVEFGFGSPGVHWGQHKLSAQEVRWMLRSRDYRQIRFIDRHGPTYELTAHRRGRDYYIVVSAYSGDIVHRQRI